MSQKTKQKQPEQQEKKFFRPQFRIRKDFFVAILFMAVFMGVTLGASAILGMNNGLAFGMALMGILMTMRNDYTLQPVKNTAILVGSNVGMVILSALGPAFFPVESVGYIIMMTATTLVTFFAAVYLFTSEEKGNSYMPLLLSFSLLSFYPVSDWTNASNWVEAMNWGQLITRMAIYAGAALLTMVVNLALHKNKFRKKIGQTLNDAIENMEAQCGGIFNGEEQAELVKRSVIIEKTLTGIEGAMGPKMSVLSRWQAGHDMMRVLTILKRVNQTLSKNYVHGEKTMTTEMHTLLMEMLESIKKFENDEISEAEISHQFDTLLAQMNPEFDHEEALDAVQMEMEDFLQGEVYHVDKKESKQSFGDWFRSKINVYNVIFALKVSILAAIGVCVTSIFHMPKGYMIPLYVGITAQPYIELSKQNVKKRIINTLFAGIILVIAFSVSHILWLHLLLTVVLCLIGDMFFEFDFTTMMGTMSSVVLSTLQAPDQVYTLIFYRVGYIAAACILLQIVDALIFPNTIPKTITKQVKQTLAINDKLRGVLSSNNCTYDTVHEILMEKRRANQRIRNTNRFAKNDGITAFLMAEEEWINRLSMINHRLKEKNYQMGDLFTMVNTAAESGNTVTLSHLETNLVITINEVLADISKAEQLIADMKQQQTAAIAA